MILTDKFERFMLACALRPIVGGNPVLDGIIKEAIDFVMNPTKQPNEAEKEKKTEEPVVEATKTDVVNV